jgi:hypothetical protein
MSSHTNISSSFTPNDRVSAKDPSVREGGAGWVTRSITLADDGTYDLGGYPREASRWEVSFIHPDLDTFADGVGDFRVEFEYPALIAPWGKRAASDSDTTDHTTIRMVSSAYDHTGGNVERELTVNCDQAHGLRVGQCVRLVLDADVSLTAAHGTAGTNADINGVFEVQGITDPDTFYVQLPSTVSHSGDDTTDTDLDGNIYIDPYPVMSYRKVIELVRLIDGAQGTFPVADATLAICSDLWDGQIDVVDLAGDSVGRFVVDAGAVNPIVADFDAAGSPNDWDDDGSDGSEGLREHTDNLIYLLNESGSTAEYQVIMKNSPVLGRRLDGFACFYSRDRQLRLDNRLGQSVTFQVRRLA